MEVLTLGFIKFLNEWEVRVFIILSLMLQILLVTLGNRRKYLFKLWVRIILWCAYISADWVAVVSLGSIAKNTLQIDECNRDPGVDLKWFWAQFLLLHLGGPDTITAYSFEDNELWLRHLLGMVIQTGFAFYLLLVAFNGSYWLPSLNVLIFVAGVIKYGERLATLFAANSENFRDSMLPDPDPGRNYPKFMGNYTMKEAEGFVVDVDEEIIDTPHPSHQDFPSPPGTPEAYDMFLIFKRLFADAILSFQDRDNSQSYFKKLSEKDAFQVVEIELAFMFDELYTKASVVYNSRGCVLRAITFSFTLFVWIAFQFMCEKKNYTVLDLGITHLLLGVAVCLEVYAVRLGLDSDWARQRLTRGEKVSPLGHVVRWFDKPNIKRWSEKMAQHNLLDLCVRHKSAVRPTGLRKITKIDNYMEKHWHKSFVDVSIDLKLLIFDELKSYIAGSDPASLWSRKGSFTLVKYTSLSLNWLTDREFDQRILLWHIATDICYSLEIEPLELLDTKRKQTASHSKHISEYMLYLLIACPFMLPIGIGMMRFRDTCAEASEFFRYRGLMSSKKVEICKNMLEVNTCVPPSKVKGDRSKTVLFDACRLAKALLEEKQQRWEIISKVWVEMLAYAATHCSGNNHARQLRKGGELLSHVWLLMAHLGITEQFQISQGHARAKLRVN